MTKDRRRVPRPRRDRRGFPRLDAATQVRYHTVTLERTYVEGRSLSKDLSERGIRFQAGQSLALGTTLRVEVRVRQRSAPVVFLGRVVRCKDIRAGVGACYDVGIEFLEIDPVDREHLLAEAYHDE